ncbi:GyrI-like domain-containing protein [Pendulispora albinea]|uniref:GyrI-like domain-containing protein n=1 Tax=Pendulispora albinea TaxID=2741071 RepID=A0ABZ2LMD7_9BACT
MNVVIKHTPTRKIAFIRHIGPYQDVGPTFARLMTWAGPKGLLGPGATVVGVPCDNPKVTPKSELRYDAGVVVADDFKGDDEVGVRELPGGEHAVVCHEGPYSELPKAYDFLVGVWLPASGRQMGAAPPYEVYLRDASTTPPEELRTEIYLPLKS